MMLWSYAMTALIDRIDKREENFKALKLWKKLKAFYDEVFRYLSKRLQEYYNDDDQLVGFENESIPAYWLRSLTGTRFSAIADLIIPYRNESRTSSITFIDVIRFYETMASINYQHDFGRGPRSPMIIFAIQSQ
ncbi:hypothetical protein SSS_04390 [Sarcoptes scabiei]|uniref:Uncharacterized protein n=1 Tax=Sarcoptes scabiei TaxID=52283 RepID=A0A834VD86_SARSC|nr:hypothetical protein SSS_04390 [Sarcoptes scabiei]